MTDDVTMPPELRGLPAPWDLTTEDALASAGSPDRVASLGTDVMVADRALSALPKLALVDPRDEDLPGDLAEYFSFTGEWFAQRIPRLDDLSVPAVAAALADGHPDVEASPAQVHALTRALLVRAGTRLAWAVVERLRAAARTDPATAEELLRLGRRHLHRLAPDDAVRLVRAVASGARQAAAGFLEETSADAHVDGAVRDKAASLLRWLEDVAAHGQ